MARLIVNQGLNTIAELASVSGTAFGQIRAGSVDDSANALVATDTAANTGGAITNFLAKAFDATFPSRAGQVVTHQFTLGTADFNTFTVKRCLVHNLAVGSVTASSASLVGGVDALSLVKQSTFSLIIQVTITYSSI